MPASLMPPRAFAIAPDGHHGMGVQAPDGAAATRDRALRYCRAAGGKDCALYAVDLAIVWPGREWRAPAPPALSPGTAAMVPDAAYLWRGEHAAGVFTWFGGGTAMLPAYLRLFNNAGFDVLRAGADTEKAGARDLADLRDRYQRVVAGGEGSGAWLAMRLVAEADVVIAASALVPDGMSLALPPAPRARLAYAQFVGDPALAEPDARRAALAADASHLQALIMLDRPDGFEGADADASLAFARFFGGCLLRFATTEKPPTGC